MRRAFFLLASFSALFATAESSAQDRPTIRFPVDAKAVAGAHGSVWSTEHYARNVGDEPIYLIERGFPCQLSAVHACDVMIRPGETIELVNQREDFQDLSLVFEITEGNPQDLVLSSHLRETALDEEPWGTELPVARDEDYRFDSLSILNVPVSNDTRISLRVFFDWIVFPATDVTLEVWATQKDQIPTPNRIVDDVLLLQRIHTPQGIYSDTLQLHDLLSGVDLPPTTERVRINVSALGGNARMWASRPSPTMRHST